MKTTLIPSQCGNTAILRSDKCSDIRTLNELDELGEGRCSVATLKSLRNENDSSANLTLSGWNVNRQSDTIS